MYWTHYGVVPFSRYWSNGSTYSLGNSITQPGLVSDGAHAWYVTKEGTRYKTPCSLFSLTERNVDAYPIVKHVRNKFHFRVYAIWLCTSKICIIFYLCWIYSPLGNGSFQVCLTWVHWPNPPLVSIHLWYQLRCHGRCVRDQESSGRLLTRTCILYNFKSDSHSVHGYIISKCST